MGELKMSCRYDYSGGSRISQRGRETPTPDFGVRTYYYRPQTKFAKVMFYTCLSATLFTGGYLGRYTPWACTLPWADTPPWAGTPPGRYTPRAGTPPPRQVHPPGRYTPRQVQPTQEQCMLGDTGNKRAVHILLECILVWQDFC